MGGTYTLLIGLARSARITFGAAGEHALAPGTYLYTGSAFGPGGFARVERHRELAAGDRAARHWHVDYLLGHDATTLHTAVRTPDADVECAVATRLRRRLEPVGALGASDCDCPTHLCYAPSPDPVPDSDPDLDPDSARPLDRLRDRVRAAHDAATAG